MLRYKPPWCLSGWSPSIVNDSVIKTSSIHSNIINGKINLEGRREGETEEVITGTLD